MFNISRNTTSFCNITIPSDKLWSTKWKINQNASFLYHDNSLNLLFVYNKNTHLQNFVLVALLNSNMIWKCNRNVINIISKTPENPFSFENKLLAHSELLLRFVSRLTFFHENKPKFWYLKPNLFFQQELLWKKLVNCDTNLNHSLLCVVSKYYHQP